MLTSPPEFFSTVASLLQREESFVLASVVAVRGAASAKTGSKAIFDREGRNILGWVGGGCAESFLSRESLEVLRGRTPRMVTVDLDDEVFGLMPCGGVMDVYLEPFFPALELTLPDCGGDWNESTTQFVKQLGYHFRLSESRASVATWGEVFRQTAVALTHKSDRPLRPYRESKGVSAENLPLSVSAGSDAGTAPLVILGQTRITEELARLAQLLEWPVTVYAQQARPDSFSQWTAVCELPLDFESVAVPPHSRVIVASHHQLDYKFIAHALRSNAEYVALVASEKRSRLIAEELRTFDLRRLYAPAGLNIPSDTPTQIAFSICCEILFLQHGGESWT